LGGQCLCLGGGGGKSARAATLVGVGLKRKRKRRSLCWRPTPRSTAPQARRVGPTCQLRPASPETLLARRVKTGIRFTPSVSLSLISGDFGEEDSKGSRSARTACADQPRWTARPAISMNWSDPIPQFSPYLICSHDSKYGLLGCVAGAGDYGDQRCSAM
jgi:hypothetical protein